MEIKIEGTTAYLKVYLKYIKVSGITVVHVGFNFHAMP